MKAEIKNKGSENPMVLLPEPGSLSQQDLSSRGGGRV